MKEKLFTPAIQEGLVSLLCYDTIGGTAVLAMISPDLYDPGWREIAQEAKKYIETYKKAPGPEHTADLIDLLSSRHPEHAEVFKRYHDSMAVTITGLNREYVLNNANTFVGYQRIQEAVTKIVPLMNVGDPEAVVSIQQEMRACLAGPPVGIPTGKLFQDTSVSLGWLDREYESFATGVTLLDRLGLGPTRKRLHLFCGPTGCGKSWWLVNLAKQAIMRGLRTVYLTLELDTQEVFQRLWQGVLSLPKRNEECSYQVFERDPDGGGANFTTKNIKREFWLGHPELREMLCGKAAQLSKRSPIYVEEFPTGSLTVHGIEATLDAMEYKHRFVPDLLLVDYPDLMTVATKEYRFNLGAIYKDLRGLAVKRNIAVAVVTQARRLAFGKKLITEADIAEDISKAATADTILTYNQTVAEHGLGLARLYVAKGRTDLGKFQVVISQAYGLGQFVRDSIGSIKGYWEQLEDRNAKDTPATSKKDGT